MCQLRGRVLSAEEVVYDRCVVSTGRLVVEQSLNRARAAQIAVSSPILRAPHGESRVELLIARADGFDTNEHRNLQLTPCKWQNHTNGAKP
jgi:hypothetical protein